jgi:hypothetical protein
MDLLMKKLIGGIDQHGNRQGHGCTHDVWGLR